MSANGIIKIIFRQAVQNNIFPFGHDVKGPSRSPSTDPAYNFLPAAVLFSTGFIAQDIHFFIHFLDGGLANIAPRFCADHPAAFMPVVLQIAVYAIGISFVFADIAHQPRTKKSAKQVVQHRCLCKIRMMTVGKRSCHANRTLYPFRIIYQSVFFFMAVAMRCIFCCCRIDHAAWPKLLFSCA